MEVPKRKFTVTGKIDHDQQPSPAPFRPKAKVNSSATPNSLRRVNASPTPRAVSPSKFTAKISRPISTPSTPVTDTARARRTSLIFAKEPNAPPPPATDWSAPKIKSKISRVALQKDTIPSPSSSRPRTRTPSISSNLSQTSSLPPPEPTIYPITTATQAANPHRYAVRSPPLRQYSPYHSDAATPTIFPVKEDLIPPLSPPISAVSFSSRSSVSVSKSSAESNPGSSPRLKSKDPPVIPMTVLEQLLNLAVPSEEHKVNGILSEDGQDHKVRAEAKSNRKIADLEITNKSLLAINASLEATKNRQAREIRELRRKLRESRLILPPPTFRAVKSNGTDEEDEDDDEEEESDDSDKAPRDDDAYLRVKLLINDLLESGRRALQTEPSDLVQGLKGGAKVLTAEEVRDWRDSTDSPSQTRPVSPALVAVPDNDDGWSDHSGSEKEVETMIFRSTPSPSPPSIRVTNPS